MTEGKWPNMNEISFSQHYFGHIERLFRRHVCCRLGWHGPSVDRNGTPANCCCWGCGHLFNPNAFKTWVVTLITGEKHEVQAVNAYHAGSMVVYGDGPWGINGLTGEVMAPVKIHRANIQSAVPKTAE